jgi:excisionase family DNA binding protein
MTNDSELLSAEEAASLLNCSTSMIYNLVASKTIPFKRFGSKKLIFVRKDIVDWASSEGTTPAVSPAALKDLRTVVNTTTEKDVSNGMKEEIEKHFGKKANIPDVRVYLKKEYMDLMVGLLEDIVQDNIENAYVEEEKESLYDLQCILKHALIGHERNFRTGLKGGRQ